MLSHEFLGESSMQGDRKPAIARDSVGRIWHVVVFALIAIYVGSTVKRARNYVSLLGIIILIGLGTIGNARFCCVHSVDLALDVD
jgi:hypothetical protein